MLSLGISISIHLIHLINGIHHAGIERFPTIILIGLVACILSMYFANCQRLSRTMLFLYLFVKTTSPSLRTVVLSFCKFANEYVMHSFLSINC